MRDLSRMSAIALPIDFVRWGILDKAYAAAAMKICSSLSYIVKSSPTRNMYTWHKRYAGSQEIDPELLLSTHDIHQCFRQVVESLHTFRSIGTSNSRTQVGRC